MFEMVVFGGGEIYRDVLQGVALMAGTNGLSTLIRVTMLMGLIFMVVKMAFDMQFKQGLRWFITAMVIVNLLWVPKAQVHITDRFNPALVGADVANVPIGLAFMSTFTSKVGARVTDLSEQAFSLPADATYSKNGMIYGAKIFERLREAQMADPGFDRNLRSFVQSCIYYDIAEGHYTVGELARQNDIWTYVTATKGTNPGRSMEYVAPATNTAEIVPCPTGVARLNSDWTGAINTSINLFQRRQRPEMPEAELRTAFLTEMNALHPMMVGASRDATNTFQQVLMINAIKRGVPAFNAEAGSDAAGVFAETQAELTMRNQQKLMGGVADKAIPLLKILTELLVIGIFPVLLPAMLLPNIGLRVLQGYFGGFLYLQLWAPMYVILHNIMMYRASTQTAAAAYIPGTSSGIKMANLEAIASLNAEIANLAGYLSLSIPVLASTIAFGGAMAVGRGGESLMASFRSGAEQAATAQTTGNISVGNTAYANHSFSNMSGLKMSTSADIDSGNVRWTDNSLNRIQQNGSGTTTLTQAAQSQLAPTINVTEGVSQTLANTANNRREESQGLRRSLAEAQSRAQTEGSEFLQAWSRGEVNSFTQGKDNRESFMAQSAALDSASTTLQQRHGYSKEVANAKVLGIAAEMYMEAGVAAPLGKLGNFKTGLRGTASASAQNSWTSRTTDSSEEARQALSETSFRDTHDKQVATYAQEAFTRTNGFNETESQRRTDTFSSTKSITETADRAETQARAYEERAEQVRSNGINTSINHANAFEGFAMERLVGQYDADGGYIDADRARRILGGQDDMRMLDQVTKSYYGHVAEQMVEPELLTTNRNSVAPTIAGSDVGPLRTLSEDSFATVNAPISRGSAGKPGDPIGNAYGNEPSEIRSPPSSVPAGDAPAPTRTEPHSPAPTAAPSAPPDHGWAGSPNVRTGFVSPERDAIRGSTAAAHNLLEEREGRTVERSVAQPSVSRVNRRYPEEG